jgi:hypothetical protein
MLCDRALSPEGDLLLNLQWIVRSECRLSRLSNHHFSFAIYSGRYLGPGAKQLATAFRIAFNLTASELNLQASSAHGYERLFSASFTS